MFPMPVWARWTVTPKVGVRGPTPTYVRRAIVYVNVKNECSGGELGEFKGIVQKTTCALKFEREKGSRIRFMTPNLVEHANWADDDVVYAFIDLGPEFSRRRVMLPLLVECPTRDRGYIYDAEPEEVEECMRRILDKVRIVGMVNPDGKLIAVGLCRKEGEKLRCGEFAFVRGRNNYSGPIQFKVLKNDLSVEASYRGKISDGVLAVDGPVERVSMGAGPEAYLDFARKVFSRLDRDMGFEEALEELKKVLGEPTYLFSGCNDEDCVMTRFFALEVPFPPLVVKFNEPHMAAMIVPGAVGEIRWGLRKIGNLQISSIKPTMGPSVFLVLADERDYKKENWKFAVWELCRGKANCYMDYMEALGKAISSRLIDAYRKAVTEYDNPRLDVPEADMVFAQALDMHHEYTRDPYVEGVLRWYKSRVRNALSMARICDGPDCEAMRKYVERKKEMERALGEARGLIRDLEKGKIPFEEFASRILETLSRVYAWQSGVLIYRKCEEKGGKEECTSVVVPVRKVGRGTWRANIERLTVGETRKTLPEVIITEKGIQSTAEAKKTIEKDPQYGKHVVYRFPTERKRKAKN